MEAGVRVEAEDVRSGRTRHTLTAYLTMVALDEAARPCQVPQLDPESPEERRRWREANLRRQIRLANPAELQWLGAGDGGLLQGPSAQG